MKEHDFPKPQAHMITSQNLCNLKIRDVKAISEYVKQLFNVDLSTHVFVSLKIKLDQFCSQQRIVDAQTLMDRLRNSQLLQKELICHIYLNEFELFRDPSMWRFMKENILKKINSTSMFKVWFPSSGEGAELISFLILRDELKLTSKIQVIYSTELKVLDKAKEGYTYNIRKHQLNQSNYKRIEGKELSESSFFKHLNKMSPNSDLFINTIYDNFNEVDSGFKKKVNMVVYRNKLLVMNNSAKCDVVKNLTQSIVPGGFLILGIKESFTDAVNKDNFSIFSQQERVYKKKTHAI